MRRRWSSGGQSLLRVAVLGIGMVGCAAQHDDSLRLSEELGRARADAAWQQSRAAELESRVARLEQRATEGARVQSAQEDKVLVRLDQLVEMNQSLLASRTPAPVSDVAAATALEAKPSAIVSAVPPVPAVGKRPTANSGPATPVVSPASGSLSTAPSPEQQLRALVESLRGRPGRLRGALTREQEDALRVLLRTERKLDGENPYPTAFY